MEGGVLLEAALRPALAPPKNGHDQYFLFNSDKKDRFSKHLFDVDVCWDIYNGLIVRAGRLFLFLFCFVLFCCVLTCKAKV